MISTSFIANQPLILLIIVSPSNLPGTGLKKCNPANLKPISNQLSLRGLSLTWLDALGYMLPQFL